LGQFAHESGGFKVLKENLNYSADGLKKIFPKYFPGNLNESYARQPQKIANRVYSSRMGNGNEASGDGFRYAGRGAIQLTGRDNYAAFDKFVDDDIMANPDLVITKYSLMSAAWFFWKNNLLVLCDKGVDVPSITAVTKRVNGGTHGLSHRIEETIKFYNLLK
jgi:putative chitinase